MELEGGLRVAWADGSSIAALTGVRVGLGQSPRRDSRGERSPWLPLETRPDSPAQIHVHRVSDAIQPSHPLSSPSPPTPNSSQHQGLFQCHDMRAFFSCMAWRAIPSPLSKLKSRVESL